MVTKIFSSEEETNYKSSAQIGLTNCENYVMITLFNSESKEIPHEIVFFNKTTAVNFVNELKRNIAKITNSPF